MHLAEAADITFTTSVIKFISLVFENLLENFWLTLEPSFHSCTMILDPNVIFMLSWALSYNAPVSFNRGSDET